MKAGLPNIHGVLDSDAGAFFAAGFSGAFTGRDEYPHYPSALNGLNRCQFPEFYASLSNPIYGNSSTVQPPALSIQYLIKY